MNNYLEVYTKMSEDYKQLLTLKKNELDVYKLAEVTSLYSGANVSSFAQYNIQRIESENSNA